MNTFLGKHAILFMFYSFCGAMIEHMVYNIPLIFTGEKPQKALANPVITGFPLYAVGAYLIVFISQFVKNQNILIQYLIYAVALTLLEYLTGLYVGAGKNSYNGDLVEAWDYSDRAFNFQGIITLKHTIFWGILGLIVSKLHPYLLKKVSYMFEN